MESTTFEIHGSTFESYVRPSSGSTQLCAWRLSVPSGLAGVPHRPDRDEVLLGLAGSLTVTVDGAAHELGAGEVVLVPAHAQMSVDGGPDGGSAWVTTTPGLRATTADGTVVEPPWAR